jgi:YqaJ-like viral recombinase domain
MTPQIHNITQGTPEWHALRLGIFTASTAGDLLTAGGAISKDKKSVGKLVNRLARERMTGRPSVDFESWDMKRGKEMEPLARAYYEKYHSPVAQVGFITNEIEGVRVGCSPDGLVGSDGGIEIKSRNEDIHFLEVLSGEVPASVMPQIQFQLMVTGRAWWDYVSFCDGWPLYVRRVEPDTRMHGILTEALAKAESAINGVIAAYRLASFGLFPTDKIPDANNSQLV